MSRITPDKYNPIYGCEKSEEHYEFCKEHRLPYLQMTYDDGIVVLMIDCHPVDGKPNPTDVKNCLHDPLTIFYFTNKDDLNRIGWAIDICREAKHLEGEALAKMMSEVLEDPDHPLNRDWLLKCNFEN